ncbi:hypothetical protein THAOC_04765, partial [Thalassiosira oceanica]
MHDGGGGDNNTYDYRKEDRHYIECPAGVECPPRAANNNVEAMAGSSPMRRIVSCALLILLPLRSVECFSSTAVRSGRSAALSQPTLKTRDVRSPEFNNRNVRTALASTPEEEERLVEEARLKVFSDRRRTIRWVLKNAESTKNYRIAKRSGTRVGP